MRINIKGGLWKNSEDEVMKASVMKYGKNNWGRVASMLPRKTAKQCKARWYEWLDPAIKKTEWSRDEDERLLHYSKQMPAQWRTIAPLVGRTAAQCIERYEMLLDAAQAKAGISGGTLSDDYRRLRAGDVDFQPETRPARPDPVDMDEDELDMIQEARARLANTKGKKMKRKAREKILAEANRLAALQKTRELRAAGIEIKAKRKPKPGEAKIDYATEIPFEMRAPQGVFDTMAEDARAATALSRTEDFEGRRIEELRERRAAAQERRQQAAAAKEQRRRAARDLPAAIAREGQNKDPEPQRKRARLSLPAPQIEAGELEELAVAAGREQAAVEAAALRAGTSLGAAGLVGSYRGTTGLSAGVGAGTPGLGLGGLLASARTPARLDTVMQEAVNQLRDQRQGQKPVLLAGQDDDDDAPTAEGGASGTQEEAPRLEGTGYGGLQPKQSLLPTPHPLSLAGAVVGGLGAAGITPGPGPSGAGSIGGASSATGRPGSVLRDELGLNMPESALMAGEAIEDEDDLARGIGAGSGALHDGAGAADGVGELGSRVGIQDAARVEDEDDDAASFSASLAGGIGGIPGRRRIGGTARGKSGDDDDDDDDDDTASIGGGSTAGGSVVTFATGTSAGSARGAGMSVEMLRRALDSLPEPQYDVDIVVPSESDLREARRRVRQAARRAAKPGRKGRAMAMEDGEENEDEDDDDYEDEDEEVEDAEVVRARELVVGRERREKELQRTSSALLARPALPRPAMRLQRHVEDALQGDASLLLSLEPSQGHDEPLPLSLSLQRAGEAVRREMVLMMRRDAELKPLLGSSETIPDTEIDLNSESKSPPPGPSLPSLPDDQLEDRVTAGDLARARALVDAETFAVSSSATLGHLGSWVRNPEERPPAPRGVSATSARMLVDTIGSAFAEEWRQAGEDGAISALAAAEGIAFDSELVGSAAGDHQLSVLQAACDRLRKLVLASRRRSLAAAQEWESVPSHRSAMQQVAAAAEQTVAYAAQAEKAGLQLAGYRELDSLERHAAATRPGQLRTELNAVEERQARLQVRYKAAAEEIARLQVVLARSGGAA